MSDVILEGFLCPICMLDFDGVVELQQHFDDTHAGEDKAVIKQLKGLFDKAKRKLLKKENEDVSTAFSGEGNAAVSDARTTYISGIDPNMWEPQELGATRSYTDSFKSVRDERMDHFILETNKLLIRLDKLISSDGPTDPNKRKVFEKAVVPWAPDADVNLCTACGKSFSITRRRHHCRLCGGIICNRCSQFLPFSYAKKLTNPAFQYEGDGFRRSSSSSSLNSILSPDGEANIRTCQPCRVLLERRDQQIEQRNTKPHFVKLYERFRQYREEADALIPSYMNMAESLRSGETTCNLQEANTNRNTLAKLYENIDLISKRIYTFGTNDSEPPNPTTLRLQRMIRSYASGYLQRNMVTLQALPTEQELDKIQEQKRIESQRRIEEERRLASEREKQKLKQKSPERVVNGGVQQGKVVRSPEYPTVQGWKPQEISLGSSDDPMVQQMNIIRGYIKQAKQVGKWDEVNMLQENLKELQKEYWVQQEKQRVDQRKKEQPGEQRKKEQPGEQQRGEQRKKEQPGEQQQVDQRKKEQQGEQRNKVQPGEQQRVDQRKKEQPGEQQRAEQRKKEQPREMQQKQQQTAFYEDINNPFSKSYMQNNPMRENFQQTSPFNANYNQNTVHSSPVNKPNTSPTKTSPKRQVSQNTSAANQQKYTPMKTCPPNPFEDEDDSKSVHSESDHSSFLNDPTNPFSENYRGQSDLNPFS